MNCECDEQLAFTLTQQFASGLLDPRFRTLVDGSGFNHVAECRAAVRHPEIGNGVGSNDINGSGLSFRIQLLNSFILPFKSVFNCL